MIPSPPKKPMVAGAGTVGVTPSLSTKQDPPEHVWRVPNAFERSKLGRSRAKSQKRVQRLLCGTTIRRFTARALKTDHFRSGSRLCENSDFELSCRNSFSITMDWKRTALPVITERRKGRKQFCAFSARARFYTASVKNGSVRARAARPFHPQSVRIFRQRAFATAAML
jgi:hypothetical protein